MKPKVKVVDGTDTRRAPPPTKGLTKALYETIHALGGAKEGEIRAFLPAAITDSSQVATKKKIATALKNAVYWGYLITDGAYYRIAPLSYYKSRQQYIRELGEERRKNKILEAAAGIIQSNHKDAGGYPVGYVMFVGAISTALGFGLGMLVTMLVLA